MTQLDERAATPALDAAGLRDTLRTTFAEGRTRPLAWRQEQLTALRRMLVEREDDFVAALAQDLGRPPAESWAADLRSTMREIEDIQHHLGDWTAPERRKLPLLFKPGKAQIIREPVGVVLIIAPWNYPVQLLVTPLAAALAAGNAVVCKPSEVAPPRRRRWPARCREYVDPAAVAVVEGGIPETTALLEQQWDHILYTGNGTVGRIVAEAAAKHLTPVTLELGGKTPAHRRPRTPTSSSPPARWRSPSSSTPARPASPSTTSSCTSPSRRSSSVCCGPRSRKRFGSEPRTQQGLRPDGQRRPHPAREEPARPGRRRGRLRR